MIFVFLGFMLLGLSLVFEGINSKDTRSVNNGVIIVLLMLLAIIYSLTVL